MIVSPQTALQNHVRGREKDLVFVVSLILFIVIIYFISYKDYFHGWFRCDIKTDVTREFSLSQKQ